MSPLNVIFLELRQRHNLDLRRKPVLWKKGKHLLDPNPMVNFLGTTPQVDKLACSDKPHSLFEPKSMLKLFPSLFTDHLSRLLLETKKHCYDGKRS